MINVLREEGRRKAYPYRIISSKPFVFTLMILFVIILITLSVRAEKIDNIKNVEINSASFNMNIKDNMMVFSKNVDIKFVNFRAKCDKATIYLSSKKSKVEKIIMTGNVKIQKDNSQINGEKVTFELLNDKISVEGNVKTKISF